MNANKSTKKCATLKILIEITLKSSYRFTFSRDYLSNKHSIFNVRPTGQTNFSNPNLTAKQIIFICEWWVGYAPVHWGTVFRAIEAAPSMQATQNAIQKHATTAFASIGNKSMKLSNELKWVLFVEISIHCLMADGRQQLNA